MGIGKLIEEVAGAVVAEQAVEKVDPDAGMLTKAGAAIAGFVGATKLSDALESHPKPAEEAIPPDPTLPDPTTTPGAST